MKKQIGLLSIVGFFGLVAAADAQPPSSSTAVAQYDGRYRFVSSAKVNQTYVSRKGQMGQCPDRRAGTLTIVKGQARYTSATGYRVRGTVGPQGELAMRSIAPSTLGGSQPIELIVSGRIDPSGTVRARQISHACSYDFVWQK
jgi:hypothetical protein